MAKKQTKKEPILGVLNEESEFQLPFINFEDHEENKRSIYKNLFDQKVTNIVDDFLNEQLEELFNQEYESNEKLKEQIKILMHAYYDIRKKHEKKYL